jgi:hypothetical protein
MSAEKGWIADPPPPCRDYIPGEEHKWRLMMGNGQFLTDEQKAELAKMKVDTTSNTQVQA